MPEAADATPIEVRRVDYRAEPDRSALVALLDMYARDPMGGGDPLSADTAAEPGTARDLSSHLFPVPRSLFSVPLDP